MERAVLPEQGAPPVPANGVTTTTAIPELS